MRSSGPANVEETFVLAGKACGRQIFGRGRTAHGDRDIGAVFLFEFPIRFARLAAQSLLIGGSVDNGARLGGALGEIGDAPLVDPGKQVTKLFPRSSLRQRVAIGASRQREAIRHPDALRRQRRIQLAQRSGLAAHQGNVLEPDILEPTDVTRSIHRAFSRAAAPPVRRRRADPIVDTLAARRMVDLAKDQSPPMILL